jgi:hypothetical protein
MILKRTLTLTVEAKACTSGWNPNVVANLDTVVVIEKELSIPVAALEAAAEVTSVGIASDSAECAHIDQVVGVVVYISLGEFHGDRGVGELCGLDEFSGGKSHGGGDKGEETDDEAEELHLEGSLEEEISFCVASKTFLEFYNSRLTWMNQGSYREAAILRR